MASLQCLKSKGSTSQLSELVILKSWRKICLDFKHCMTLVDCTLHSMWRLVKKSTTISMLTMKKKESYFAVFYNWAFGNAQKNFFVKVIEEGGRRVVFCTSLYLKYFTCNKCSKIPFCSFLFHVRSSYVVEVQQLKWNWGFIFFIGEIKGTSASTPLWLRWFHSLLECCDAACLTWCQE